VADAVFYQIFPDRFARSSHILKPTNLEDWDSPPTRHGYKGGDLRGVFERLDWLTDLGINALYLNPIFQSASNHRYHTHDYYRVDPLLGGDEAFEILLDACHSRGIRVILDGVFNHASRGFFQFNDILENGFESPWVEWFTITGLPLNPYRKGVPPNYHSWWGNPALPKFNTDHPDVREYLMGIAEYWIGRGVDGWRLDVPAEITTAGFWEEFRTRVRAVNPDAYLVGEIWDDASDWLNRGDRFDAAMNYVFAGKTLAFVAGRRIDPEYAEGVDYPIVPPVDAAEYGDAMEALLTLYPEHTTRSNFNLLGSHDTARSLTVAGGDVDSVILAALLMLTHPGAPCVYYGDEVGMTGGREPASRGAFPWDDRASWNQSILHTFRTLIALRHAHPSLRHGSYRRLATPPRSNLYLFIRETDQERLLIAVNAGEEAVSASVHQPQINNGFKPLWGAGQIRTEGDRTRLTLQPRSGAVWGMTP
jgi:cyclomaltodextrinase/neopullulanase